MKSAINEPRAPHALEAQRAVCELPERNTFDGEGVAWYVTSTVVEMTDRAPSKRAVPCGPHAADRPHVAAVSDGAFERAAALFRAAGDLARLRLLHRLDAGECCVTELADASETKLSTLSQQLRVLHAERIVKRRRDGKHIFYSLADDHVRELIRAALDHASEPAAVATPPQGKKKQP